MSSRRLTDDERAKLAPLLDDVRVKLRELADGDEGLHWALRRRFWNQLQYDERLRPQYRAALKRKKNIEQAGLCNVCKQPLPKSNAVLDRHDAMLGYTMENTQLLCGACDRNKQIKNRYA